MFSSCFQSVSIIVFENYDLKHYMPWFSRCEQCNVVVDWTAYLSFRRTVGLTLLMRYFVTNPTPMKMMKTSQQKRMTTQTRTITTPECLARRCFPLRGIVSTVNSRCFLYLSQ